MSDLVGRLRYMSNNVVWPKDLMVSAADEIGRLLNENAGLSRWVEELQEQVKELSAFDSRNTT